MVDTMNPYANSLLPDLLPKLMPLLQDPLTSPLIRSAHLEGTISSSSSSAYNLGGGDYIQYEAPKPSLGIDVKYGPWRNPSYDVGFSDKFSLGKIRILDNYVDQPYQQNLQLTIPIRINDPVSATADVQIPIRISQDRANLSIDFGNIVFNGGVFNFLNLPGQNSSPILFSYNSANNVTGNEQFATSASYREIELFGNLTVFSGSIFENAVQVGYRGGTIAARFTPNFGLTLDQAAKLTGYKNFNWYQKFTYDETKTYSTPWTDPPKDTTIERKKWTDDLPYYWNQIEKPLVPPTNVIVDPNIYWGSSNLTDGKSLYFIDTPMKSTNNEFERADRRVETFLVGVNQKYEGLSDALYRFSWETDYKQVVADLVPSYYKGGVKWVRPNLAIDVSFSNGLFYANDLVVDNALNVRVKNSGLAAFRSIESVSESAALRSGNQVSDLDFTPGLIELDTNALIRSAQDLIVDFPLTSI